MAKNKKKKKEVNEPAVEYKRREFKFFTSFEEMDEYDRLQTLKQSPEKRLQETVELILRVYGLTRESLKNRKRDNIIYFDKAE